MESVTPDVLPLPAFRFEHPNPQNESDIFALIKMQRLHAIEDKTGILSDEAYEDAIKRKPENFLVLRRADGTLAGFIRHGSDGAAGSNQSVAMPNALYVDMKARGLGAGFALVAAYIGWARHKGFTILSTHVRPDNAAMHTLYGKLGFTWNPPLTGEFGTYFGALNEVCRMRAVSALSPERAAHTAAHLFIKGLAA